MQGGSMSGATDQPPVHPRTAYAMLQDSRRLSFGCPVVDEVFGGGIPTEGICEIAGMAGSGKTQIMLQLLVQQQRPVQEGGLGGGGAFFLSTEGAFPARRFREMLAASFPTQAPQILERVMIMEAKNVDDQRAILNEKLPGLLNDAQLDLRLVVVDSMAALFRSEFGANLDDSVDRAKILFGMAKLMKMLSHHFRVPFVVTNQVTADFGAMNAANAVMPALGLSWSTCVNTRFMVTRRDGMSRSLQAFSEQMQAARREAPLTNFTRELRAVFSPVIATDLSCEFFIANSGVHGVPAYRPPSPPPQQQQQQQQQQHGVDAMVN